MGRYVLNFIVPPFGCRILKTRFRFRTEHDIKEMMEIFGESNLLRTDIFYYSFHNEYWDGGRRMTMTSYDYLIRSHRIKRYFVSNCLCSAGVFNKKRHKKFIAIAKKLPKTDFDKALLEKACTEANEIQICLILLTTRNQEQIEVSFNSLYIVIDYDMYLALKLLLRTPVRKMFIDNIDSLRRISGGRFRKVRKILFSV